MNEHDHGVHHGHTAVTDPASAHNDHTADGAPAGGMSDHGHADHGGHAGHGDHVAKFRRLFWIMLVLAVPVVGFSMMFSMLIGYALPDAGWVRWVSPVLGTVMYAWGGAPFLSGAVSELRARKPGMMLLIALAITVAFIASWHASLGLVDHQLDFWWELALLIVIMLLGHWIEMRSLAQTTSALDSLAALLPDEAEKVDGDTTVTVAPADLRVGDTVVVRPGGRVPADGRIVQGSASMDESMITGSPAPCVGMTATKSWPARLPPTPVSAWKSPRWARTQPSPASESWSPTRRTLLPARSGWPTARRHGCSGSRWVQALSPRWSGRCWVPPMTR